MAEGIKIEIGAETSQAQRGIDNVTKSLNKLKTATQGGKVSLQELNRVAQDAPFGFIAISNNLEMLPDLFRRVGAAAKETGQSGLKIFFSSLLSAGPIFSIVTAA